MSVRRNRIGILIVALLLAIVSVQCAEERIIQLYKEDVSKECTDKCVFKCHEDGKENCYDECGCEHPSGPSNEDLFLQNACYATCGQECVLLDDIVSRQECILACPCQCNQYCLTHCLSLGLEDVCDHSCGCTRPVQRESKEADVNRRAKAEIVDDAEKEKKKHEKKKEEKKEKEDKKEKEKEDEEDDHKDKHHNKHEDKDNEEHEDKHEKKHEKKHEEKSHDDDEDCEDDTTEAIAAISSVTSAVHKEESQKSKDFKTIVSGVLSQSEFCDPTCWRKCLQTKGSRQETFNCINECGCGYESPNLLISTSGPSEVLDAESSTGCMIFLFMCVLIAAGTVGFYVYRREYDHKLHQDLINEEDNEGGYEKLD